MDQLLHFPVRMQLLPDVVSHVRFFLFTGGCFTDSSLFLFPEAKIEKLLKRLVEMGLERNFPLLVFLFLRPFFVILGFPPLFSLVDEQTVENVEFRSDPSAPTPFETP